MARANEQMVVTVGEGPALTPGPSALPEYFDRRQTLGDAAHTLVVGLRKKKNLALYTPCRLLSRWNCSVPGGRTREILLRWLL